MLEDQNKARIRDYFSALSGSNKSMSLVSEYVADEDRALKDHIAAAEGAFARYEMVIEDLIAQGDKVAVRARFRGTQTGEFNGVPATGRAFDVALHITYRMANNMIVAHWMVADTLALLQQLGIVATPTTRI